MISFGFLTRPLRISKGYSAILQTTRMVFPNHTISML